VDRNKTYCFHKLVLNLPAPLDIQWPKCFQLQGASPPDPLTRGSAPGRLCLRGWAPPATHYHFNHWGYAMLMAMSAVQRRDYTSERASSSSLWLLGLEECACECQIWNWVIGSPGQWVIWVIFHVRVTESPVHHVTRCETRVFPVFEKMPKMQNVHLIC